MKESEHELISRVLDGNVSEFEAKRVLKEFKSDPELKAKFKRYNLIGHAIRKQLPAHLSNDFSDQVMSKISENFSPKDISNESKNEFTNSNKIKATVGLAIAASVAIFSFLAFQNFIQPNVNTTNVPVVAERVIKDSDIQRVSREELQSIISDPAAAAEFNSYIVNHAEYASPRVSLPHVRIVGYDQIQNFDQK